VRPNSPKSRPQDISGGPTAISFATEMLLYIPCLSSLAVLQPEIRSWPDKSTRAKIHCAVKRKAFAEIQSVACIYIKIVYSERKRQTESGLQRHYMSS
jgi:Fe2+ transport system protein B